MSAEPSIPDTFDDARLPGNYDEAWRAMARCAGLDECADWTDPAAAFASYARQAQDSDLEDMARVIRDRAIRRMRDIVNCTQPIEEGTDRDPGDVAACKRAFMEMARARLSLVQMADVQNVMTLEEKRRLLDAFQAVGEVLDKTIPKLRADIAKMPDA